MDEKMEKKAHEWLYIMIWVLGGHPGNMFLSHDNRFRRCAEPKEHFSPLSSGFYKDQSCLNIISLKSQAVLWILDDSFLKELT